MLKMHSFKAVLFRKISQFGGKIETRIQYAVVSFFFLIEVKLMYSVVRASAVQQSDSILHTHTCSFLKISFSIMICPRILDIAPCAIQ